jgi:hypothetical protein
MSMRETSFRMKLICRKQSGEMERTFVAVNRVDPVDLSALKAALLLAFGPNWSSTCPLGNLNLNSN